MHFYLNTKFLIFALIRSEPRSSLGIVNTILVLRIFLRELKRIEICLLCFLNYLSQDALYK